MYFITDVWVDVVVEGQRMNSNYKVSSLIWRAASGGLDALDELEEGSNVVLEVALGQIVTQNPLMSHFMKNYPSSTSSPKTSKISSPPLKTLPCPACGEYFENRLKLQHHQDRICYKRNEPNEVKTRGRGGGKDGDRPGWIRDMITTPGAPKVIATGGGAGRSRGRGRGRGPRRGGPNTAPNVIVNPDAVTVARMAASVAQQQETRAVLVPEFDWPEDDMEPKKRRGRPRIHPIKSLLRSVVFFLPTGLSVCFHVCPSTCLFVSMLIACLFGQRQKSCSMKIFRSVRSSGRPSAAVCVFLARLVNISFHDVNQFAVGNVDVDLK